MSHPNSYGEALTPNVTTSGNRAYKEVFGVKRVLKRGALV